MNWLRAVDSLAWIAVLLGLLVAVAVVRVRLFSRESRMVRFARRRGYQFRQSSRGALASWPDLACLQIGENRRTTNWIEGERGGRRFSAFDYHYELETFEQEAGAAAGRVMLLSGPWIVWLLPFVDAVRDPAYSAAVVECAIPPGTATAAAKRGFAPWRVEFGANASVVRSDDGFRSPEELLAAVDRLNAALDEILRGVPATAS